MRKNIILILIVLTAFSCSNKLIKNEKETIPVLTGKYLGQEKTKLESEIFALGIVSKVNEYEFGSVFSKDGNEFYYAVDIAGKSEIRFMVQKSDKWTEPQKINFNNNFSFNDPFLSPDGNRLYFISDMPLYGSGEKKDIDIWYAKRNGENWSKPINAGDIINSEKDEYYISFSGKGTMYFASNVETSKSTKWNFDIYYSELSDGIYQKPVKMCDNINTTGYEADVFISPDENYIIFCSSRKDGYGQGDLYISFNKNGKWTKAKNMGSEINTKEHELCPFVTNDGNFFFIPVIRIFIG